MDDLGCVRVVNAHQRLIALDLHKPLIDGKGADGRRQVAAVCRVIDHGLSDRDLGKGVIQIGPLNGRRADDHSLGKGGNTAPHAIQLTTVNIRAADSGEEDTVPQAGVSRQVAVMKEDPLAGSATHEDCGIFKLCHWTYFLFCFSCCGSPSFETALTRPLRMRIIV